jgi:hypothetical protein
MHRDLDGDGRMDPETGPGLQPRVSVEEHELKRNMNSKSFEKPTQPATWHDSRGTATSF